MAWVEADVVTNLHEQSIGTSTEHTLYVWVCAKSHTQYCTCVACSQDYPGTYSLLCSNSSMQKWSPAKDRGRCGSINDSE